jgi:hypothetical protein
MTPAAHIAHRLQDRVRLRIPEKRHDTSYFALVADAFAALPGIRGVQANALTGSLLLHHHAVSPERISAFAQERSLFCVVAKRNDVMPLSARLSAGLHEFDDKIRVHSDGRLDFWGAVFLLLAGVSIIQVAKGNILAPASTLLWYALGTFAVPQQFRPLDADA